MSKSLRMPAEWENPSRILMTFPDENTDWNYCLPEARRQFSGLLDLFLQNGESVILLCRQPEIISSFLDREKPESLELITDIDFNDTWTRDYGPLTVIENDKTLELDFGFNAWGLKFAADKDNLVNLNLARSGRLDEERYRNHRDFILEGGSVETDGRGTLLTTTQCLCSPNRNGGKSKAELETILGERLGLSHFLWLDHGFLAGDDTDSHIDTLARIAPDDTIVYVGPPKDTSDIHYDELCKMRDQLKDFKTPENEPYRLVELPFPDPVYSDDGERLPATYANYLVTGRNLFMPEYGQPENDKRAKNLLQQVFPNHKISGTDCRTLLLQHGSLHCSTMQLY